MQKMFKIVCVASGLLVMAGCAQKRDTAPKAGVGVDEHYTSGYYDGYYGRYLGGYWNRDGRYYFKNGNTYQPDTEGHFRHDPAPGFAYFEGVPGEGYVDRAGGTTVTDQGVYSHTDERIVNPDGSTVTRSHTAGPTGSTTTTTTMP